MKTTTTIELSNKCQLKCKYCINRLITSETGIMTDDIFDASCKLLEKLCARGTQQEVNLNGNGESCLDPQLAERVLRVKRIVGKERKVQLSTNGINLTAEMALDLKHAGLDMLYISVHSPYHTRRAVDIVKSAGLPGAINPGPFVASHNWAGQLEQEHRVRIDFRIECHPLKEDRGYITRDGYITPCCYDYRNLGAYAHVMDDDAVTRSGQQYALCRDCHQVITDKTREALCKSRR